MIDLLVRNPLLLLFTVAAIGYLLGRVSLGGVKLGVAAVLMNWISTGDHLIVTLARGYWPVAGLDLAMLVVSALAAFTALRLGSREAARESADPLDLVRSEEAERA